MQNPKDDVLYAPVEWVDHSEGYTDIRYPQIHRWHCQNHD